MSYYELNKSNIDCGSAKLENSNQPILKVLNYVESQLFTFIEENFGKNDLNEDNYTEKLCDILNLYTSEKPFWFHFQSIEKQAKGHDAKIDFSVKTRKTIIVGNHEFNPKQRYFAFEAKILGVKEKYREKEYLMGKDSKGKIKHCGGVERFKRNIHCEELQSVGMLGYILKENSEFWLNSINSWIYDFSENNPDKTISWSNTETLSTQKKSVKISKLKSKHQRNSKNTDITIYHYWCQLN